MEERHQPSTGAAPRTGVECLEAEPDELIQLRLHVVGPVGHVVQAATATVQEGGDLGIGPGGTEELDPRLTDLEHRRLDAVGLHELTVAR